MALLSFPVSPANNDLYPIVPVVGQYQYQWSAADLTWRLVGAATGVTAGTYGDTVNVGQFTVDAVGRISFAQNVPIQLGDTTQVGLVQLVDNTTTSDATKALTAAQGYNLQLQIGDIALLSPPAIDLVAAINAAGSPTGVVAGTYGSSTLIPRITVNSQGRITAATAVSPFVATTANLGVVRVGTNINVSSGIISVATASTTTPGISQLVDDTVTNSPTKALTAAQGYNLQQQINALSVSNNLTFAGTIDGATGLMTFVTTEATAIGFTLGGPLPSPSATNKEYFVIVAGAGTFTPTGGVPTACVNGDWFLSTGTTWRLLSIGTPVTPAPSIKNYDNVAASFNGVLTTFPLRISTLAVPPTPTTNIMVFLGGVAQTPGTAYTISGASITFSDPPLANTHFYATTVA